MPRLIASFALAMLILLSGFYSANAAEGNVRLSLGTLAPRGSIYHQALLTMAEQWRTASGGTVALKVFPDGTQGGEADMVRLMNVGSLQAGLLTAVGLSQIEPGIGGMQNLPMIFHDLSELDAVKEKLSPMLAKRMEDKATWSSSGWTPAGSDIFPNNPSSPRRI